MCLYLLKKTRVDSLFWTVSLHKGTLQHDSNPFVEKCITYVYCSISNSNKFLVYYIAQTIELNNICIQCRGLIGRN